VSQSSALAATNNNVEMHRNVVHRHEPPVTSTPVRNLHHDKEREFIVINKPGSIVRPFPPSRALALFLTDARCNIIARARDGPVLLLISHRDSAEGFWI